MDFFRVVAGNHDHLGNISAQIAYSNLSARWRFDDLYYSMHEKAADGSTLDIIYIDTVVLSGISDLPNGQQLRGSELPGPADVSAAESQWDWLEAQLKASDADFLVVAGAT